MTQPSAPTRRGPLPALVILVVVVLVFFPGARAAIITALEIGGAVLFAAFLMAFVMLPTSPRRR